LTGMPTVVNRQKLRSMCDLPPSTCVPAAKLPCARRLPEDRCQTTSRGAYEIPLLSPEVSGACDWGPHRRCRKLKTAKDPRPSNIRLQCSALRYSRPHSGLSGTPLLMPLYPWRWGRYSEAFKYLMIIFRLVIIEPSPAVLHLLATGKALATNRVLLCQTFPIIVSSPTVRCLESCSAPPVRYYPSRAAFSAALRRRKRNFRADRSRLLFPRPRAAHWIPRFASWSRASRRGLVFHLSS
jgi:hypothetical protein